MVKLNRQLEKLLTCSVKQYCELQKETAELVKMIDEKEYSKVGEHAVQLKAMQADACLNDEQLLPLLKEDIIDLEKNELFTKRLEYIQSIVDLNRSILPKIKSAMVVTSAEIREISGGRTAIAGYASQTSNRSFLGVVG